MKQKDHIKPNKNPASKFAGRFLRWFCPDHLLEEIEGDLLQRFQHDVKNYGEGKAGRRLWWNVIRFFRPGIILRRKFAFQLMSGAMFNIHTKIVLRQALRNRAFTAINVLGLTLGIAVFLMVAQFIWFEWSFERFNKNADHVYRVNLYNTHNGVFDKITPHTPPGLAYAMKTTLSGVQSIARVSYKHVGMVSDKEKRHAGRETGIVFADQAILDLLAVDLVQGGKNKLQLHSRAVAISETVAEKYFGRMNATGNILEIGFPGSSAESEPYEVLAVFRDLPANTHQRFDILLTPRDIQQWDENWAWSDVMTYATLRPHTHPEQLQEGLAAIVRQHHVDAVGDRYLLEPLSQIRLHALDGSGRAGTVGFFLLLGFAILLLAWFNYINLSTARFMERTKEAGIRKLVGANRRQLVFQFLTESFLFNTLAFALALALFALLWPVIMSFLELTIPMTLFHEPGFFPLILSFVLAGTLCSGFYPAIFLSSFNPLQSLKGKVTLFEDRATLRKGLVILQLSISVILVTAVLAIRKQINFMEDQQLGITLDQTLIIEAPLLTDGTSINQYEPFKNEILALPAVEGLTYASSYPGKEIGWHRTDIYLAEENVGYRFNSRIISVGIDFPHVFGLTLKAGRNFDPERESDKTAAMLLNESACKMFGFHDYDSAIGKVVFIGSRRFEVTGVLNDYHYRSLQSNIQPILYIQGYPRDPSYAIKISPRKLEESLPVIEAKWKESYPGNVFSYYFLDERFNRQYSTDQQLGTIVTTLAAMAIFISCAGLFGLTLYSVGRRTKEIGIRKVLGATVTGIVLLLSREFVTLIVISGVLSIPLAYKGLDYWLEGYAYKMPLDGSLFGIPLFVVAMFVLISIGTETMRASRRNPAESIKHE